MTRYGKWTVVSYEGVDRSGHKMVGARCDCGAEKIVQLGHLRSGRSTGCRACSNTTHGASRTPEYRAWSDMIGRCTNPDHANFAYYGGRGIGVCAEWRASYVAFAASVGPRPSPGLTLERIDNERGYEPGNVRWATRSEQQRNTRRSRRVEREIA